MLKIDSKIFEDYPDLVVGVLELKDVNNQSMHTEVAELLKSAEQNLRERGIESVDDFPNIRAWQDAHRKFNNNPKRFAPSVQAVAKRVIKGGSLPNINTLVDLYNYISLEYILPVGGEDVDACVGDVLLTKADGTEEFFEIGSDVSDPPESGEVIYKDNKGVVCRKFNWREADRTKLTKETKNAILVIEALPPTSMEELQESIEELKSLVTKYCGGSLTHKIYSKDSANN